MKNRVVTRRALLRGAGVALALPWMESLAPRRAGAAPAAAAPLRYLPIFLPNGASRNWPATGVGANWALGPVLEPFGDLKAKMIALANIENGSAFNKNGSSSVEPSHGRQPGAWLTCVDARTVIARLGVADANGVSVDQMMATRPAIIGNTPLPSMQLGLSTVYSSCDTDPATNKACNCSISRSVSWKTETQPTYKQVDPLTVFNSLVAVAKPGGGTTMMDPSAQKRIALRRSVLDAVLSSASNTQKRLGKNDQLRMSEFLDSLRAVEMRATQVSTGMGGVACTLGSKPTMATVTPNGIRHTTATYNKGDHADAMNALIVMAFQCDLTRVLTYMLEDERSEFVYDHVPRRTFNATTSTASSGVCPEYHAGGQHGDANDYATMTWWNVGKVADLCRKLDAIKEANGLSILDNSVVLFGGAMHADDHACKQLPTVLLGSGGGKLKVNQNVVLNNRPLRDLHFTIMNAVFNMGVTDFGQNLTGAPITTITEILTT